MKLDNLGNDILIYILDKLDQKSILICSYVNRHFRNLITRRDFIFVKLYKSFFLGDEAVSNYLTKFRGTSLLNDFKKR